MYNLDREKLKSIIENSSFSDDSDTNKQVRNAFLTFFTELCDYSERVNNSILNKSAICENNGMLEEIGVVLMDRNDGEKFGNDIGLVRMTETTNTIFVNADHESVKKIVGDDGERKKYTGEYIKDGRTIPFEYSLRFNRSYVERQELIYSYVQHYAFLNPIIYSPFSFRSFDLVYDKEIADEQLDFLFPQNGLDVIGTTDKDLFWNISISEQSKTYDAKIPYGDSCRYIFEFKKTKKGNYALPLPQNKQTKIFDIEFTDDAVRVTSDHDMDEFYLLEPLEIDNSSSTIKALISYGLYFSNKNTYVGITNKRIISEADIEHALAPFRDKFGVTCQLSDGSGEIIKRYSKKYRPDRKDSKLINQICREYIKFSSKDDNGYLVDYINYILEYLEYYYPEVEWVGEI